MVSAVSMNRVDSPTTDICGLPISMLLPNEVTDEITRRVEQGIGTRMVTLNVEGLARSKRNPEYAEWMRSADMIVPDGMPIVWAINRRKLRKITRVTGVDLTADLLRRVDPNLIGIIGGKNPTLALEKLDAPVGLRVLVNAAILTPSDQVFDDLAEQFAGRRLLFIALGIPKQDIFAMELQKRMPNAVIIPNGGTFEMLGGMVKRAPIWMQSVGLEWLFRLCNEPRRLWRRILVDYWGGIFTLITDRKV
ncbi:MAG: WecB/TagA/CpsF family glycosyltransferase [Chthonomonas sp.]|nr:WecB/TagA/CpsF family glycosyltransferase [Chthonomonas sp.]